MTQQQSQRPKLRLASVMQLKPGTEQTYKERHNALWPEMATLLKTHGAHQYSIFLHPETLQLFAYLEVDDAARWQAIADSEVCQRWWCYMSDIMLVNDDLSPKHTSLTNMFYFE